MGIGESEEGQEEGVFLSDLEGLVAEMKRTKWWTTLGLRSETWRP